MANSITGAPSLSSQLIAAVLARPIQLADQQRSALHLLDWLGCVAAALPSAAALPFATLAHSEKAQAKGGYRALWTCDSGFEQALGFNAALGNVLEMDDVHRSSILHPGPVVIPAALAMAQRQGAGLSELLNAILLGYEVSIRIGRAIGRSHYRYFHNTSSCAAFGAAMAAGYLLKLSPQQLLWALGNTGSRTGGLWQMRHETVLTKQWHNAEAARSGVNAALLAAAGLTGPAYILEGPQGLFAATSSDAEPAAVLAAEPGWLAHQCTFKPWPACRHAHPALDAVSSLLAQAGIQHLTAAEVSRIEIGCYQDALTFCDRLEVQTENQAKFSIQHAVAARLLWGEPALSHYQLPVLALPEVAALKQKILLHADPLLEQAYPAHFGARATLKLVDGRQFSIWLDDTLGDPERPLSQQQLLEKARGLFAYGGVPLAASQALCQLLGQWQVTADDSLQPLLAACAALSSPSTPFSPA